jgi:NADH-quinone oxidoreductase subunit H
VTLLALGDPLLSKVDNVTVLIVVIKTVVTFAVVLVSVLFMVWFERKIISDMQNRIGPNVAGPWGILQSLADGVKLFFKEGILPERADRPVYRLAPYLSAVPAFLAFAIVPVGGEVSIAHRRTLLQLADPPIGILWLLCMSGIAVYGVMLAGWSSGSKYPLLGSVRASAQLVSYEAVLGLTVATVVLVTGSLRTSAIVASQHGGFLNHWNFLRTLLIPFALFAIAITAEMTRPPFDLVEAEEELSGGYNLEYSSIDFAWFYLAEYAFLVTNSAIIVTLWFGGPDGPRIAGNSIGPIWFMIKVLIVLFVYVWIRATLPRLRYDQLMDLGWKRLIPASLAMLMIVAGRQINYGWGLVAFGASVLLFAVFLRAVDVGRGATQVEAARQERLTQEGRP